MPRGSSSEGGAGGAVGGRVGGATLAHPPQLRARALSALLTGERPAVVARGDLGVPEATVRTWKRRLRVGKSETLKKGEFGELLTEYLRSSLTSLIALSSEMTEPAILRRLGAGEIALHFGLLFDKTMRMLELAPLFATIGDIGNTHNGKERHEPHEAQG